MNDQKKLWESAYTVMNHPRMGPYMHGAAMVERTTGVKHFWLVRGPCTTSVVQELQRQLGKAYQFGTKAAPAARAETQSEDRRGDRRLAGLLLAGLFSIALCALARR